MNFQDLWEKSLKNTEIVRARVKPLHTQDATHLPYVFLAESSLNYGDTVVRSGEVVVEKPEIVLLQHLPQFDGFEFEDKFPVNQDSLTTFLLLRGIKFPSLKYNNRTNALDIFEGRLGKAIEHYEHDLQQKEDIQTGLVKGLEDCWQFSVLIFICSQILRQADGDIRRLLDEYKKDSL